MKSIPLFRIKTARIKAERLTQIAKALGMEGKTHSNEEALIVHDNTKALAYGQPCSKFAGVLFFTDQSQALGAEVKKLVDKKTALRWTREFLKKNDLLPEPVKDDRIQLQIEPACHQAEAVMFDGKERKPVKVKSDITARITLNDIPVEGPRAKLRMSFKDKTQPAMVHLGMWESIEVYEERELIGENEVYMAVKEKLGSRECGTPGYDIVDMRLVYYADEFSGGPDLLLPYYLVEIAFEDKKGREMGILEGPSTILPVPAYR
jgi:hypothetical protein